MNEKSKLLMSPQGLWNAIKLRAFLRSAKVLALPKRRSPHEIILPGWLRCVHKYCSYCKSMPRQGLPICRTQNNKQICPVRGYPS